jgi:acyl-CoA synthetase (AMP-forming)/AMP-acid ligase II
MGTVSMILHDQALIDEYSGLGYWSTETLFDWFRQTAAGHPERIAVEDPPDRIDLVGTEPQHLTYAQLARRVDALATSLMDRGLRRDDVVVVQLPNTWELIALYLALCRAGAIISPLPMQWRQRELRYISALAESRWYVAPPVYKGFDHHAMADALGGDTPLRQLISIDDVSLMTCRETDTARLDAASPGANDVATLCWTSGTEADPKGCPLTHNNWLFLGRLIARVADLRQGDRLLATAPIVNMTGVGAGLVGWLATGGTLVLHHPLNMPVLLRQLVSDDVQFTLMVPALLNMIAKRPDIDQIDLSSLRTIATGSAPPSGWVLEEFRRRWGIEIANLWGQNEGPVLAAGAADVPDLSQRAENFPYWSPERRWPSAIPGVHAKLLDDDDEVTTPGQIGELVYRGPNVFPGYFRRPDLNERLFAPGGFLRTGDLFIVRDDRHVGFHDRKKDIIIRGGFNISAAEVENIAQSHPDVIEAAAVAVPHDVLGEQVCLFVVPQKPAEPPDLASITDFMRGGGLAAYKLPERLEFTDQLPRNPVGKVLKTELRRRLQPPNEVRAL